MVLSFVKSWLISKSLLVSMSISRRPIDRNTTTKSKAIWLAKANPSQPSLSRVGPSSTSVATPVVQQSHLLQRMDSLFAAQIVVFDERFAGLQAENVSLRDLIRGMQAQLDLNPSTLSNVSANVFQIEINVQSLLLKHKDDSVDDLAEDEETTLGNPSDDFDEDDEYGAVMMDFLHPSHTAGDPSLSLQSFFQDGQDPLDSPEPLTQDPPSLNGQFCFPHPFVHCDKKGKKYVLRGRWLLVVQLVLLHPCIIQIHLL